MFILLSQFLAISLYDLKSEKQRNQLVDHPRLKALYWMFMDAVNVLREHVKVFSNRFSSWVNKTHFGSVIMFRHNLYLCYLITLKMEKENIESIWKSFNQFLPHTWWKYISPSDNRICGHFNTNNSNRSYFSSGPTLLFPSLPSE